MKKSISLFAPVLAAPMAVALTATASNVWADHDEIPFDEAFLFFELNNTDGDLGIHSKIDGDAWKRLEIEDPRERRMLNIYVQGRLRRQGLTELFFESAEPPFDELAPEKFFKRFPEGIYEIEGKTLDGVEIESETELTHVMPAPAVVQVNGINAAPSCDDELPVVAEGDDVVLSWAEVTDSHPTIGTPGVSIDVVNYEVVVEIDETPFKVSAILPPEAREFEVPEEILELDEAEIKFEVLVREASYNQTAVESCFCIEECPEDDEEE